MRRGNLGISSPTVPLPVPARWEQQLLSMSLSLCSSSLQWG